jgi:hypothetical protein
MHSGKRPAKLVKATLKSAETRELEITSGGSP